ncbi:hypothetical protein SJ053_10195 [Enterobacter kobei]|uniref:hypothetical protein n=1 Tax=Enterobacter kobei TaxID=208224 RepID=UPI0029DC77B7|nr:hypothetical protein [Enterobacter kobei]MDX7049622.1 hypothetical protein [Enterobacter kobei]
MNIETVNELIASLESAGELSIREQKFLKLAKEFRICSASLDAAIKTGNMLADQNAQLAAENAGLKVFGDKLYSMYKGLETSGGGFHDEQSIPYQQAALDAAMSAFEEIETPATDAFLAEVRAQGRNEGINYAASRLAAAYNHGFIGKSMSEVADVVHMILDTKEELENSTRPAADGLSGEYAEAFLEDSAAQLRKGVQS